MTSEEVQAEIALTIKAYLDNKRRIACLRARLRRTGRDFNIVGMVLEEREPRQASNPIYDIGSAEFGERVAAIDPAPILADLQSLREALAEKATLERDLTDSGYKELLAE